MTELLTVEEHRAGVLAAVSLLPAETVSLSEAAGRTLAEPVLAAHDAPGFDNSSMDGFAVRFRDVEGADAARPTTLKVVADLPAGATDDPALAAGEVARIMTGAPVPTDADAVVPFEDTAGGLADSLDTVLSAGARPGALAAADVVPPVHVPLYGSQSTA